MRSVMEHQFSQVPRADIPRSSFNRSHGLKTTFDADWLVPILVDDIIPGDTFSVNVSHFARVGSPFLHPIMDNLYLETFFFFVPYRLLWSNWEKFCGARTDPADSIDYTIPKLSTNTSYDLTTGSLGPLANYLGLPWRPVDCSEISALPFRAYNLIYNEWFRDENLQDSVTVSLDDGPDADATDYTLLKRGKRHDYFTSCLPWPQKGDAVELPLGTSAPVLGLGVRSGATSANSGYTFVESGGNSGTYAGDFPVDVQTPAGFYMGAETTSTGSINTTTNQLNIRADLTAATAATINDLRLAFQTQRLLERDARSGTRYTETLLAHFGVTVPDFRLQRPEFLGGGSTIINVQEVPNTSEDATNKQGYLAAYGRGGGSSGFTKSFVEHGLVIGLANVRGDITYSQGVERYWFKDTRYDFFYPVLSMIGEQAVLNREIFYDASDTFPRSSAFGYQERYAEYRYKPSRLAALFSPDHASTLASWHLSEDFSTGPTLGDTFIQSNTGTPLDRAIAVPSQPQLIVDFFFDMKCARPMPLYGVPGNLDHF